MYDIVFHPAEMRQPGDMKKTQAERTREHIMACVEKLSEWIGRQALLDEKTLQRHINQRPAMPITVFRNLDDEELCRIWELEPWIDGMDVEPRYVRDYKLPGVLSQTLGFTANYRHENEFSGTDYSRIYVQPDQIGRSGLELEYDKELSGMAGATLVRVDPLGYAHETLPGTLPVFNGMDLLLTIDSRAQQLGEQLLQGHKGSIVVLDANTGAVIVMASSPSFSLDELTTDSYRFMNQDNENKPMLNRAVNAQYTPGSLVKPLVGLAALECGVIDTEWRYNCIGYLKIGDQKIRCARHAGHGELDVYDAITVSCNPFFMAAGLRAKLAHLEPMFQAAGFGEKTGIDFLEFAKGLCPSKKAAKELYNRNWLIIDTAYCSMGQGLIQVTPLQVAVYCAALANGGNVMRPYLVQEIRDSEGGIVRQTLPVVRGHLPVSGQNMEVIRSAMGNVVESDSGSAKLLRNLTQKDSNGQEARVYVAAKTGTAEIGTGEQKTKDTWMIVFGPLPEAKYAFACVIEHGDSGGRTVGPIAFEFWKQWLNM
ncbi:MAG: hypothetical protein J6X55_02440 [Victivallales bacterium]|nr:hypothetical protein [Victivallales bacterium]